MREFFEKQLKANPPLTEKHLNLFKDKNYFNGDEKQIGDVVLFAMLIGDVVEKENDISEMPIDLITLNEKHFDLFEPDKGREKGIFKFSGRDIPVIKKKK